jgi:hypothetical protein
MGTSRHRQALAGGGAAARKSAQPPMLGRRFLRSVIASCRATAGAAAGPDTSCDGPALSVVFRAWPCCGVSMRALMTSKEKVAPL